MNTKFIPIVFSRNDIINIPLFLTSTTYYDLSNVDGYESLYRRLTSQPEVIKPPLGDLRSLPPRDTRQTNSQPIGATTAVRPEALALLLYEDGTSLLVSSVKIEAGETIRASLIASDPRESGSLARLRNEKGRDLGIAFGTSAYLGKLKGVEQVHEEGREIWNLEIRPQESPPGPFEISVQGYDADRLAELRACRILLDEPLPRYQSGGDFEQAFLESFVRGFQVSIKTNRSPFPVLYKSLADKPETFIAACRLFGTLFLRLSGVVEAVYELDLELEANGMLKVHFRGRRHRKYANVEPATIFVDGSCPLNGNETKA